MTGTAPRREDQAVEHARTLGGLAGHHQELAAALALWIDRDDSRPQPEVRRAANTAVDAMDAMLRELYLMRGRLVSEIRVSDDIAMARSAETLEHARQLTEAGDG